MACAGGVAARVDRLAVTGTRVPDLRASDNPLVEGGGLRSRLRGGRRCRRGGEHKGA